MKLLRSLLSGQTLDRNGNLIEPDPTDFESAMAAIDRAAMDRARTSERRDGEERRTGQPDTRPPGSPERRRALERRTPSQTFGKRGA